MPWVDAGGVLLPSIVGAVMLLGWVIWLHRLRLCFALILMPAVVLLAGHLGLLTEALRSSGYHHTRGLARAKVGDHSAVATAAEIAPALISAILVAAAVWRWRSMQRHARR